MDSYDYSRILVPTDMSDFSAQALRYAAALRERLGSTVTLLYADETHFPIDVMEIPLGAYLEQAPQTTARLAEKLRSYAHDHLGSCAVETLVIRDTPARAIVRTARDMRADLVVMGTHGRSGWRRALLGSVAESVLHETDRPVLTVTPAVPSHGHPPAIRRIVCPVNFTFIAREALQHATALAQAFEAELLIVYVTEGSHSPHLREIEAAFALWVDPAVRARARYSLTLVPEGDPAERVLATAREAEADLIVLGAQHRYFSDATVIGTTTERITRFARCPVLTVVRKARTEVRVHEDALVEASV
jgi:nucleotide-binding universal stress UspA family protein